MNNFILCGNLPPEFEEDKDINAPSPQRRVLPGRLYDEAPMTVRLSRHHSRLGIRMLGN